MFTERKDRMADRHASNRPGASTNTWSGVFFGLGLMALIDEIIFHQLLQWHHFYNHSTTQVGIFSDGLLNAFALFAIVAGLFMFADLRRRNTLRLRKFISSVLIGDGSFQLADGIVNHKLLRVHQVRYGVEDIWPYDLGWIVTGVILLVCGVILFAKSNRREGG